MMLLVGLEGELMEVELPGDVLLGRAGEAILDWEEVGGAAAV